MNRTDYINDKNIQRLKNDIGSDRLIHSLGVMEECEKLANFYNIDVNMAMISGLFHDCGKFVEKEKAYKFIIEHNVDIKEEFLENYQLLHPALGCHVARIIYGIENEEILSAIYYHTTLRKEPTILEKILYIADAIEPGRDYDGVEELRKLAYKDLNRAVLFSLERTIVDIINKGKYLGIDSVISRNFLLNELNKR